MSVVALAAPGPRDGALGSPRRHNAPVQHVPWSAGVAEEVGLEVADADFGLGSADVQLPSLRQDAVIAMACWFIVLTNDDGSDIR